MLNAEICIRSIDYERTFESLFPMLMETVNKMDADNLLIRLLQKLGESSKTMVISILQKLSHQHQDEILCRMVSYYHAEICKQLNALFEANGFGNCIIVQGLGVRSCVDGMVVTLNDVKLDYPALSQNEKVQQGIGNAAEGSKVGQLFMSFSGNRSGVMSKKISDKVSSLSQKKGTGMVLNLLSGGIEKQTLNYLEKNYLPEQLGKMASGFLEAKGIYAEVSAVEIQHSAENMLQEEPENLLTKELEFAVVDAVVEYLKERENLM